MQAAAVPDAGQEYVVHLGDSLRKDGDALPKTNHCNFRYEFQPASVDPSVCGLVSVDKMQTVQVKMAHASAPHGIEFKGKAMDNKDIDCVLVYDPETHTFVLEKLVMSCTQLKPVRRQKASMKRKLPAVIGQKSKLNVA